MINQILQYLPRLDRRECTNTSQMNTCEKPADSSKLTTWAIIGGMSGLLVATMLLVLIWLHCRRKKRDKKEDAAFDGDDFNDDCAMDDLEVAKPKNAKPKPKRFSLSRNDQLDASQKPTQGRDWI